MSGSSKEHIIKSYDDELARLTGEIVRMGELAATQLEAAIDVVERRDERAAQRVVANDDAIDQLEQEISHDVVRLLALRAPMAGDLRNVFAALRIAADIERIGDYAANVAKRSIPLSMVAPITPTSGLAYLAELAAAEVREVLAAYGERDADRAYEVWQNDAELDDAYTGYFRQLLTYMMEDPRNITPCTHLLFMAKNIERIGDHATNIAENIWFQVHGEPLNAQRSKRDFTSSPELPHLGDKGKA
ncbi:phosphate signaling complex protein PhoU [Fulvimonas soli]|uniref:Phosphate-specific transport system accessory protein PhoU n=1 Tax=Fulvimonas soli TaxID=155197 RepID=A0A316HJ14_9GAMM|nr:phosphate signaling complex protein PhoU [Fulvimonas soli]PWK81228.1 PhoU-like phosphate uptake regulator [Fulvimonas soli]TNY25585.1 phosphate transport system regulatory protein PhoU [Fulvimonas soli]